MSVDPTGDITVDGLTVNNSLGTITAEAYCGGLIGYQRTYTENDREGGTPVCASAGHCGKQQQCAGNGQGFYQ